MQLINRKQLFCLSLFMATGLLLSGLLYLLYDDWCRTICDAVVTSTMFSLTTWIGILAVRHYPTHAGIAIYALLTGILTGLFAWYGSSAIITWLRTDDTVFHSLYQLTAIPRLIILLIISGWILTLYAAQRKIDDIDERLRNSADAAALRRDAELFKLRQQLQPHFLYNSLNSINALIFSDPAKAQEMVGKLSDFLRDTVKRETQQSIPLEEELQYIENYLSIESIRFGDRLHVNWEKEVTCDLPVPPFMLQPILENAIKFGLYGITGKVDIHIRITRNEDMLELQISNPFDPHCRPPAGTGFGLHGVARRLFLLFARTDLLVTGKEGNIFITTVKIPLEHA